MIYHYDKDYKIKTLYSDKMEIIQNKVSSISKIANYLTIIFLCFSVIMFMNFIVFSINANKKNIGILRSIGTNKKDIYKIYAFESIVIGIVTIILSILLIMFLTNIGNKIISNNLFFTAEVLIFRIEIIYTLIFVTIFVIILSSIIPIYKLSNLKPIDAIYNR